MAATDKMLLVYIPRTCAGVHRAHGNVLFFALSLFLFYSYLQFGCYSGGCGSGGRAGWPMIRWSEVHIPASPVHNLQFII